ncbi:MAG: HEAT repeat domain-containing protein, partial [Candidatus Hydrogenedentes bacterium]|nr:HEAT repeat domain-containing protein [Candidatus Hydrogenedentota bacterium]
MGLRSVSFVSGLAILVIGSVGCGPRLPDAIAPLVDMLQHEDGSTRMAACTALGRTGAAAAPAIPFLMAALRDPDPGVRSTAADALLALGAREALSELQRALGTEAILWVRLSLASALCGLGPEGIAAVADYVQRPEHANMAGDLCDILLRSGDAQAAVTAVDVAVTQGIKAGRGLNLPGLTPSQQTALVAWFGETLTGADTRAQAALLHSGHLRFFLADPQVTAWVEQLVTSDSERVRYGVVKTLAGSAGSAWKALLTAAVDPAPRVRGAAMEALQPISVPEVEQFFVGALNGPPLERSQAGRYFGARGNALAIDALVDAQRSGARDEGLRELSAICDPRAAEAFLALLAGDPDHVARFVLPHLYNLITRCVCSQPPCLPDALAPLISAEALAEALRHPGLMEAGLQARHRDLLNPWIALAGLVDSASSAALLDEAKRYLDGEERAGRIGNMEARV